MHRVLSIDEIIQAIFQQIDDQDRDQLWEDTLAALVRTCRTFHGPALEILWAAVQDIEWLIRIIPDDAYTKVSDESTHYSFDKYASCIRELDLRGVSRGLDQLFVRVLRQRPSQLAFSKLTSLGLDFTCSQFLPCLSIFLTPKLLSFKLAIQDKKDYADSELSDLRALGTTCPDLQTLYLHFNHPEWSTFVSELVCTCHRIKKFYSGRPLSNAAVRHVTRLPNLEELQIATNSIRSIPLPNASLALASAAGNYAFLRPIQSAPRVFSLWAAAQPSMGDTEAFLRWMSTLKAPSSLVEFDWKATDFRPYQNRLDPSVFRLLFGFSSLRRLTINGICALPLDNDTLKAMARALPHLEDLSVNWSSGWTEPRTTFHGLAWLFKGCRNLRELCIAIDATQVDPLPEELKGPLVQNIHLTELRLVDSSIVNARATALLLLELLPQLGRVYYCSSHQAFDPMHMSARSLLWAQVNICLSTYTISQLT
ncbi:hypothetical protein HYDPIDRAFT_39442 [Hydnomerulius pinastri MD-312]|nr:hypothetical protein HYDPIDRAFT_39442 [Hydnomerulius pinastri MD-312]